MPNPNHFPKLVLDFVTGENYQHTASRRNVVYSKVTIIFLVTMLYMGFSDSANAYPVFGKSNISCSSWLSEKDNRYLRFSQKQFVAGYLTALNIASHSDQTGNMDIDSAVDSIDKICTKNPNWKVIDVLNVITFVQLFPDAISDGRKPQWGL